MLQSLQSKEELDHSRRCPVKARRLQSQIPVLDITVGHKEKTPKLHCENS